MDMQDSIDPVLLRRRLDHTFRTQKYQSFQSSTIPLCGHNNCHLSTMNSNDNSSIASGAFGSSGLDRDGVSQSGGHGSHTATSSYHGESTSVSSNSTKLSKEEQEQLAAMETQMIRRYRFFFFLMAMAAVAAVLSSCIQLSEETAQLLKKAGKEHWLEPRKDKVVAKGKGEMQTWWLLLKEEKSQAATTTAEASGSNDDEHYIGRRCSLDCDIQEVLEREKSNAKMQRMVGWVVDILASLLRQIVATQLWSPEGCMIAGGWEVQVVASSTSAVAKVDSADCVLRR